MGIAAQFLGAAEAQALLERIGAAAKTLGGDSVAIGWPVTTPYAYGVEFGVTQGGRLARRAGGALALTTAFQAVQPRVAEALAAALPDGPEAARAALERLGFDVQAGAMAILDATVYASPIPSSGRGRPAYARTGNLRRTLFSQPSWR